MEVGAGGARPTAGGIAAAWASENGPPVVLLHGFGSDRQSWGLNQPALAAFARTVAVDLPAHGESDPHVGDGTIASLANRIAAFLDHEGWGPAHLVGHSLGGAVAMELAHHHPRHVASLFLLAPAALGRGVDHSFLSRFAEMTQLDEAEALLQALVSRPRLMGRHIAERTLAHLARPGVREGLRRIAHALVDARTALALAIEAIAASTLPRHVVWGRDDRTNPLDNARLDAFGGRVTVLEETRHLPQIESPARVNAVLCTFLQEEAFPRAGRG